MTLNAPLYCEILTIVVLITFNWQIKFEMPSFIRSEHIIRVPIYRNVSRDPDHTQLRIVSHQ